MTRKSSSAPVESTNDYSIVSKYSTQLKNYVDDDFIKYFVDCKRKPNRAPLINRGYYIRFKAIEWALAEVKPDIVITLGCGFDTSAFRHLNVKFIEIDLPLVARRKCQTIKDSGILSNVSLYSGEDDFGISVLLTNERYSLIAGNLKDDKQLSPVVIRELERLQSNGDSLNKVAFLNECSLCYLTETNSNHIISRLSEAIKRSPLNISSVNYIGYEHLKPVSSVEKVQGFSEFMLNHFASLGSPIKTFISKEEQFVRFRKTLNFDSVVVMDMMEFYGDLVSVEEKLRIAELEMFDEYEELDLLCSCYALTVASTDLKSKREPVNLSSLQKCSESFELSAEYVKSPSCVQRFAMCSTELGGDQTLIFGGFGIGKSEESHRRHSDFVQFDADSESFQILRNSSNVSERLFAQLVNLDGTRLILDGGRRSPKQVCDSLLLMKEADEMVVSVDLTDIMPSRWRHTLCRTVGNNLISFGGLTCESTDYTAYEVDLSAGRAHVLAVDFDTRRHSHATTVFQENSLVVTGGYTSHADNLEHVIYDCRSGSSVRLQGLPKKLYSHTAHLTSDFCLALCGGIDELGANNKVITFDLRTMSVIGYESIAPADDIIMLHNFCSHYSRSTNQLFAFGGGGNCFSFGTHLNHVSLKMKLGVTQGN
ncbi:tRNA wybutosine-synthesizing protein 4 [Halotydeus destructor]|nr:tRNA wybutosine-synthesizing protein 4 [Halotydeus destructor]